MFRNNNTLKSKRIGDELKLSESGFLRLIRLE